MQIAVFEDDLTFATQLETLIRQYTHHPTSINTCVAGEIFNWIKKTVEPALYLLDIMSDGQTTGFQIAQHITEWQSCSLIVFITAYPEKIQFNSIYKTKAFSFIQKNAPMLEREIMETISLAEKAFLAKCLYIHLGKFEDLYIPHEKISLWKR